MNEELELFSAAFVMPAANSENNRDVAEGSSYGVFSRTISFSLPVGSEKH